MKKAAPQFMHKKSRLTVSGVSVQVDWLVVLAVSLLLLAGLLFWSWQTYTSIADKSILETGPDIAEQKTVDTKKLIRVSNAYKQRVQTFNELTGGLPLFETVTVPVEAPDTETASSSVSSATTSADVFEPEQ